MEKVAPESSKSSPQNFQKKLNMEPPPKKKIPHACIHLKG